jgi:hypothetical protein
MSIYKYCVYLTIYYGNKLPPFYIGSSSLTNIAKGYNGSVCSIKYKDIWKSERKINPALFKTKIISTHYTRKEAYCKEEKIQKQLNVVKSPLYINCSFAIERFDNTGISLSVEHKLKLSNVAKGIPKSELTKLRMKKPKTAEHNKKVSLAKQSMTPVICPHCLLSGNKAVMTRFHFNNCKQNPKYNKNDILTCPHCNKQGRGNMTRYHFNNCKKRKGA